MNSIKEQEGEHSAPHNLYLGGEVHFAHFAEWHLCRTAT